MAASIWAGPSPPAAAMSRASDEGGKATELAGYATVRGLAAGSCAHGRAATLDRPRSQRKKPWRDRLVILSLRLQERGLCNINRLAFAAYFLSISPEVKKILSSRPPTAGLPTKISTDLVDTCSEERKRRKTANIG